MVNQSKFNMSIATLERIDAKLKSAARAYELGNIIKYFFSLKGAKLQAQFKFKDKAIRPKLEELEVAYLSSIKTVDKWKAVEEYHTYLMDCLDKYGLLLPDKIDDLNTAY